LGIWERKILRKISGPVRANSAWKIRANQGPMDLYGGKKKQTKKKTKNFGNEDSLVGHVKRTPEERWRNCLRISQKEKGPLESQETDGWTMLKMI